MNEMGRAFEKALHSYEEKDYEGAEKGVDIMLSLNPAFARALFLKAVILEDTGRADEAEEHFRKAGPISFFLLRLAMQLQERDPERALRHFKRVSELDAGNNIVWLNMGKIHERAGRHKEANACYRHISLPGEIMNKLIAPVGFFVVMLVSAITLLSHGDYPLASLVIGSGVICLFWLKRDGGRAIEMIKKRGLARHAE